MKKILLALALCLLPVVASAQCTGVFAAGRVCGSLLGGVPQPVPFTSFLPAATAITSLTGDVTATGPGAAAATLATVNGNVGSFGTATQVGTFTVNGKGLITAATNTTMTPAIGSITGLGTGVGTALAINTGTTGGIVRLIASGAKALATSAIGSAACSSAQTDTATGTLTTDAITASFNGDPTAVTGFVPLTTGMLAIIVYPTADTVNFKVCNNTNGSITPGAITLNWRVVR